VHNYCGLLQWPIQWVQSVCARNQDYLAEARGPLGPSLLHLDPPIRYRLIFIKTYLWEIEKNKVKNSCMHLSWMFFKWRRIHKLCGVRGNLHTFLNIFKWEY
jgi:hypothetical protein